MHPKTIDASPRLLLQFLAWVGDRPRNYTETMDAWRTSCPRISVWEDALIEGLITADAGSAGTQAEVEVVLTQRGKRVLALARPAVSKPLAALHHQ